MVASDVFSNSVLVFYSHCLQLLGLSLVCSSYQWIGDTIHVRVVVSSYTNMRLLAVNKSSMMCHVELLWSWYPHSGECPLKSPVLIVLK